MRLTPEVVAGTSRRWCDAPARGGAVVNIVADIWGSMPGMAHSGAARAGIVSFTETAALEWAGSGVRVNAVAPGYIASSGMDTYEGAFKAVIPTVTAQAAPVIQFLMSLMII